MIRLLYAVLVLLPVLAGAASAAAEPVSIKANYDISTSGIRIGKIEETYQRSDSRYKLTSITQAVGFFSLFKRGRIIVTSEGEIDAHGLKPLSVSVVHEDNAKDNRQAELDWSSLQLALIHQNKRNVIDLPAGTQDRLSAMYQFMFLPMQATRLQFYMVNNGYLLNFDFQVSKGPVLKTSVGEFATLYLDNKDQGARERTELWLATGSYNLPVKMIVTDPNGGKITQLLSKLEIVQP